MVDIVKLIFVDVVAFVTFVVTILAIPILIEWIMFSIYNKSKGE